MATEYKLSYTAAQIDEKLGKIDSLSSKIDNLSGISGINEEQITALNNMFKVCVFIKADVSQEYNAFKAAFGISNSGDDVEPEEPHTHSYTSAVTKEATCTTDGVRTYTCSCNETYTEVIPATGHTYVDGVCTVCGAADPNYEPDVPEVTLSSISATYSGGDVAVGTEVTALSSIVVTAHYSDGSTETVTGYTLSGTIGEGDNTVTVSYEGKTTTFTVTGVAESGGEEEPHTHSYTSAVTKEATCTTDGVRTYTCTCGHSYTESIAATGHTYVDGVCTVCGASDPSYVPEVTLSSISATYNGGDVTVGTAVTDLTGIVVTAHYSDGSTEAVTGYTLSGTIGEGSNTITVSYNGMTTTFDITGIVESDGTDWTANEAYTNYNWLDRHFVADGGGNGSHSDYSASDYMPCAGVSTLMSSQTISYGAFYDSNKTYISSCKPKAGERLPVPENAAFFRIAGNTETVKTISIIPDYVAEVADGWEDGVPYVFETWQNGYCAGSYIGTHADFVTSDYMPCYGASTLKNGTATKYSYAAWYDADKKFISKFNLAATIGDQETVPENASYFRISKATGAADPIITPHA